MPARPRAPRAHDDIAHYYDRNTRRFLAFGGGGSSQAIHRQLWAPGIDNANDAAAYINVQLINALEQAKLTEAFELIDWGSGVGGTLFALAEHFPHSRLHGVTISSRQYELACRSRDALELGARCRFWRGDFESIELRVSADAAIAIESFAHAQSRQAFFANAARHLKSEGLLIVIDDFILTRDAGADRCIREFRDGWRLPSLGTLNECVDAAGSAGFALIETRDLSPLIRLDRLPERLIARLGPLLGRLRLSGVPLFANLIGGGALTRGLRDGTLGYRWLSFKRAQ